MDNKTIYLNGENLNCEDLFHIGNNPSTLIKLCPNAEKKIKNSRKVISQILEKGEIKYGINTGFGNFASVKIPKDKVELLQYNLIKSHSVGVGKPILLSQARMLLALRINVLSRGNSGISFETISYLLNILNKNLLSWIPTKGSVGASGDLAPLSHLAAGMIGQGLMWNPKKGKYEEAKSVLKEFSIETLKLGAKEGLSLINGTQFICALGCEALIRAKRALNQANIISAITLEALHGTTTAFDKRIHIARKHSGQIEVAKQIWNLLLDINPLSTEEQKPKPSEIQQSHKNCGRVQDAYVLRCIPQVHGIILDTIKFSQNILETEFNSSTDNPMVFSDSKDDEEEIISGGNFHGEYPAKALDYLGIGIAELANISERRIARLIDSNSSKLPAFLVKEGGINSGFMMAHVTAAALTSENKVLVHPSSSDTIPTSANKEDHVSMGPYSARKALQIIKNVEYVIAIELICACQALDFSKPLKSTPAIEEVHKFVRSKIKFYEKDKFLSPDIEVAKKMIEEGAIENVVNQYHVSSLKKKEIKTEEK